MGNFDIYLERYCRKNKVNPEIAMTHKLVQEIKTYYETEVEENINVHTATQLSTSCC